MALCLLNPLSFNPWKKRILKEKKKAFVDSGKHSLCPLFVGIFGVFDV